MTHLFFPVGLVVDGIHTHEVQGKIDSPAQSAISRSVRKTNTAPCWRPPEVTTDGNMADLSSEANWPENNREPE